MSAGKLLLPIFAVAIVCSIAAAQNAPGGQSVVVTRAFSTTSIGTKLEKSSYLGVAATPAPAALREQLKLKPGIGLVVEHVDQGSPAEQAGLKQYDIIEKFNDQWMVNSQQLAVLIRMAEPNSEIKLAIIRQAQPQTLSAKLAEKELPVLSTVIGVDDQSAGLNFITKGSGMVEPDPKNPGGVRISLTNNAGQLRVTSTAGDYDLTLTRENGKTHLAARNKTDNSQFDRDINSDEDLNDMPPELAKMAKRLLSTTKIALPATSPAAR